MDTRQLDGHSQELSKGLARIYCVASIFTPWVLITGFWGYSVNDWLGWVVLVCIAAAMLRGLDLRVARAGIDAPKESSIPIRNYHPQALLLLAGQAGLGSSGRRIFVALALSGWACMAALLVMLWGSSFMSMFGL